MNRGYLTWAQGRKQLLSEHMDELMRQLLVFQEYIFRISIHVNQNLHILEIKETKIGKWASQMPVYGDLDGGFPLVIFNKAMDTTLVLSPATTFMSATQYSFKNIQTGDMTLTFGPMSSIDEVLPSASKYYKCLLLFVYVLEFNSVFLFFKFFF